MVLGTPRRWWIAAILPLVLGLALLATGVGGTPGAVGGGLLLVAGIAVFAGAPMRHGRGTREPTPGSAAPTLPTTPTVAASPRPRPKIEAGDPSEV